MSITDRLTERKWTSSKPELLPCPCCGSSSVSLDEMGMGLVEVWCKNKKCGIRTGKVPSITIAVGIWNRRLI